MTEKLLQNSEHPQSTLKQETGTPPSSKQDFDEITFLAKQLSLAAVTVLCLHDSDSNCRVVSVCGIKESFLPFPGALDIESGVNRIIFKEDFDTGIFVQPPELGNFNFYAGSPLVDPEGKTIGILYVLHPTELIFSAQQALGLSLLRNQIIRLLDSRKQHTQLQVVEEQLRQKYNDLEKFASVVSHDIKSPLANIISLTEFLREENSDSFSEETRSYLDFLSQSSYSLRNYVDGILTFYRSDKILEKEKEKVDLPELLRGIAQLYRVAPDVEITYPSSGTLENVNKAALSQIFMNLISNALKYNDKKLRQVSISFQQDSEFYIFRVHDNGNGIAIEDSTKIFDLFTTLDHNDRDGNPGSGIGLATVKKMLVHMGGDIALKSTPGVGSDFSFKIRKK